MAIFLDKDVITQKKTDTVRFMEYIKSSNVTYFTRGAYGIGFKIQIKDPSKSNYKILSLNNTENTIRCSQLFVKLSPILDDNDDGKYDSQYEYIDNRLDIRPTPSKEFLTEIKTQNRVYKKTNHNLEAVCPPIVYSNVVNNTSQGARRLLAALIDQMSEQNNNDDDDGYLPSFRNLLSELPDMRLGVIAMSFAENYKTLSEVMTDNTYSYEQKSFYLYRATYELIRLYDIGFMHGDYHLYNILINTNYQYSHLKGLFTGRCLIIDFGMTFKKPKKYTNTLTPSEKLQKIALEKQPDTEQNAETWPAYKWLLSFLHNEGNKDRINGSNRFDATYKDLQDNILHFQEKMIVKIKEKYPGLIEYVRSVNATNYRNSVLKGGRAITENSNYNIKELVAPSGKENMTEIQLDKVQSPRQDMVVNRKMNHSKDITDMEFEQIFNPMGMDMDKVVIEYENTLKNGVLSFTDDNNTKDSIQKGGVKKTINRFTMKTRKTKKQNRKRAKKSRKKQQN